METMNPPLFHQWFLDKFHTGESWLKARTTYTNSLAVTSIIGNIIGLGDRHCENIQICEKTGEVVHIDLNMIFNRGRSLKVKGRKSFFSNFSFVSLEIFDDP